MTRADRRRADRAARKAMKHIRTGQLTHPVPESVQLKGGPMDGYIVKPDAPALKPEWINGLHEARAAGLYNASLSPTGEAIAPPKGATKWAELDDATRQPFREQARREIPAGRYIRSGTAARWVESD